MAIDKNYKPTERDFFQFNAWIKGKNLRPRLLGKFKSEQDYESFMIEAQDKYMYCESGRTFSKDREKVPADILEKAKTDGVVQQDKDGNWRIISLKDGEFWNAHYQTKESAKAALRGYHAQKGFSNLYNNLPRNEHDQISVDESIPEGTTEGFYDDFMFYPSKGDWKLDFMNSDYGDREMDAVVIVEDGIAEIYAVDDFVKGKKSKDQK